MSVASVCSALTLITMELWLVEVKGKIKTEICLSRTEICLSQTEICLSQTEICLSRTQICLSQTEICLSDRDMSLSDTDMPLWTVVHDHMVLAKFLHKLHAGLKVKQS